MVGNRFRKIVFFVSRPLNSLDGIIPSFAIGCADCQLTSFHSFILSLFLYFLVLTVPVPCVPGVSASSRTFSLFFLLFYPYVFVCYPYVARRYLMTYFQFFFCLTSPPTPRPQLTPTATCSHATTPSKNQVLNQVFKNQVFWLCHAHAFLNFRGHGNKC